MVARDAAIAGYEDARVHFQHLSCAGSVEAVADAKDRGGRVSAEVTRERVAEAFAKTFEGEPFVCVPKKRLPEVVAVSGSNYAEVSFEIGPDEGGTRVIACFSAIDNLIKGGAGQAVQSMNLALGLPEMRSLEDPGGYP